MYKFCINIEVIVGFLNYVVYYFILKIIKSDGVYIYIFFESIKELIV